MRPLIDRFMEKMIPEPNSGCWLWTASVDGRGYGQINVGRTYSKMMRAHRISFEIFKGAIPNGMMVLHKCDVRTCVNPDHLFLGVSQDNVSDMIEKKRHHNQRRTHCRVRGHPLTPDNVYLWKSGRVCKSCVLINRNKRGLI